MALAFIMYLCALGLVARWGYLRTHNRSDFLVGGRKLSYWVTALSAHASDMSSWLFLGLPAAVFLRGLNEAWVAVGLVLGMALVWTFVAPRIRCLSEHTGSVTLPHFFQKLLAPNQRMVQVVASGASLFFFVFYVASGFKGIGILSAWSFGWDHWVGVVIGALVIMGYTILGGFMMVAWTDAFQAVFLLIMIVLVPLVAWWSGRLPSFELGPLSFDQGWITAVSWGLGYFGMPHILTKFMAIDDPRSIPKACCLGLLWQITALLASVTCGLIAGHILTQVNAESFFLDLISELFSPFVLGLTLCAIIAATVSTIDSQIIVSATTLSSDLLPQGEKSGLSRVRLSILVITVLGAAIAIFSEQSLYEIVRYAWAGQGATFGPLMIGILFFKLGPYASICSMVTGAVVAALWPIYGSFFQDQAMIPAFTLAAVVLLVGSRVELGDSFGRRLKS